LCKDPDKRCAQPSELILFDQFVQVDTQQLEDQAEMLSVDECVFQPEKMVVVILIELRVELQKS
jgi:hypothetical protein